MADPTLRPATIHGYADRLSVAPGETIEFKVSCDEPGSYRADLVRLDPRRHQPRRPGLQGRGDRERDQRRRTPGRHQPIASGSHVIVDDEDGALALRGPFTLHAFVYPTTPGKDGQRILGRRSAESGAGYALDDRGRAAHAARRRASVSADVPLWASCWYSVGGTYDPATGQAYDLPGARAQLLQQPALAHGRDPRARARERGGRRWPARLRHAARDRRVRERGGRRRRPHARRGALQRQDRRAQAVRARALGERARRALERRRRRARPACSRTGTSPSASARAASRPTTSPTSAGSGHAGNCVNQPARGMTGWNWDCSEECYRHAPELYGAIHFHDDDLDDCRWDTDFALEVPGRPAERRLRAAPRPGRGRGPRPVLRAARRAAPRRRTSSSSCRPPATSPTRTTTSSTTCPSRSRSWATRRASPSRTSTLYGNLDVGLSTYDVHSDGCGVCFSSVAPADHEHAAQVPPRHGLGVAVPGRPPPRRLAERRGLRLRRRHRPRAAPRGRRPPAPLPRRAHRLAPGVLHASACSTPGRSTSATAAAACTSAPTASTGSRRGTRRSRG